MPVEIKSYSDLRPITFNLEDPDRSLDLSVPNKFSTQQGLNLLEYNFLLSANDLKSKNYTHNFLTSRFTEDQIFDLLLPEPAVRSFNTTIQFATSAADDDTGGYLTMGKNNSPLTSLAFFSKLSANDAEPIGSQNFVISLSNNDDVRPICQIYTFDGVNKKYLVQRSPFSDEVVNDIPYPLHFDTLSSASDAGRSIFDVILNGDYMRLGIFGDTSSYSPLSTEIRNKAYNIQQVGTSSISAYPGPDAANYKQNTFKISNPEYDFNYYKSSNNFVNYTSGADVDSAKTLSGLDYNFLMYSDYENNTVSGGDIFGNINYFNLKNHISNHFNVNKNLFHTNQQVQREYNTILNNETTETSEEFLKLNYNFYTSEYNFKPDTLSKFILPSNILPFEAVNINDAAFQNAGAYAAGSPYFSDRVIKDVDGRSVNNENQRGKYLCSWLYDNNDGGIWYDRYYIPSNKSGLSGSGFGPGLYALPLSSSQSDIDKILIARALSGLNYYDVESTMMLEPSGAYHYKRIGKKYVKTIIDTQKDSLLKRNFTPRDVRDKELINPEVTTLTLNPTSYDTFTFPVDNKGSLNSFNLSFAMNVPDLEDAKAYQLIGNLFNTGISIVKNFYFTPFIYLQQGGSLYFYNTDFELIKQSSFPTVTAIRDVLYLNQNNDFIVVGENSEGARLIRGSYTGDVVKENNDIVIQSAFRDFKPSSRCIFNVGSKVTLKNNQIVGANAYDLDLNSLVANNNNTTTFEPGEASVIRRLNNTVFGTMSGLRGVNLDDTYGAAISGHNQIIFKNFYTDNTFLALSSSSKIWDINALDEKLYIQANNELKVFNSNRELLSSYSLSTSAVSGYKIDFISDNYVIKPIAFSRKSDGNLIVDKINYDDTTAGYTLSTYSLGISGIDLGYDFFEDEYAGWFVNPTNLYSIDQTFKEFENKYCLVTRFDNEISAEVSDFVWDSVASPFSASDAGNWTVNYVGAGNAIDDNSTLTVLEDIEPGMNCINIDADLITGQVQVYINGNKSVDKFITTGVKPLKNYLNNDFYIGLPNYSVDTISDFVTNQNFNALNTTLQDFYVYDTRLSTDLIYYHYLNCSSIDPVNFDVLTSTRNNIETVDNMFSYKIPGSLSNRIKIYVKNAGLSDADAKLLANILASKINTFLPKNITTIEFDYSIGNNIKLLDDASLVIDVPLIGEAGVSTEGDPFAGPDQDYLESETGAPVLTDDGFYIFLD